MAFPRNAQNTRKVHVEVLLMITTGLMFGKHAAFRDMHELIEWFTGDSIWTHQLKLACDEIIPYLIEWYPELNQDVSHIVGNKDACLEWIDTFIAENGATRIVMPIPADDHDPNSLEKVQQDLFDLGVSEDKIIGLDLTEDEDDISPYGTLPPKA